MSNNVEEKILHGTTTVGIKATDGVVLCADMRASAGYFIANNNTMKIQKIEQHVGLTLAGGVADAQNIVDVLKMFNIKIIINIFKWFSLFLKAGIKKK